MGDGFDPGDATIGWVDVPFPGGISTITIPEGSTHVRMRIVMHDNDDETVPTQIAHMHIDDASFPVPPTPFEPSLRVGWSSDFRFLIQQDENCPE